MGIRSIALLVLVGASLPAKAELKIDGRIDEPEWSQARRVTDFRMVQPLSREATPYPTEAFILSTPEGLAIGFRNTQTADIPRTRQRSQRDAGGPVDRVNLYVDFDGDSRAGYNFTVTLADGIIDTTINNENQFNDDWDGDWRHATSEDGDTWSAEMLIPWHIAPMQKADGDTRTIGISLDRVIGERNERMAWPAITYSEPRFLSVFERIEIPQHSQSLLAFTPYVVGVYDDVGGNGQFDVGADIFWKPNGQFQLTATLNPDFGQVESDQLVVNFSAVESFFSDKRPFFTENQGYFDVLFGSLGNANRLIYTRRVGGPADDGSGSGDVTAAVKLNGSFGGLNYGVFAATEADDIGRDFFALRATRDGERQGFGMMLTRVDRPFLDREATVLSFDHTWKPREGLNIRTALVGSSIDQAGLRSSDSGGQIRIDHDLGNGLRQQFYWLHTGDRLQLNDFGFLDRNNFNYARYELARRLTNLPESSPFSSHQWRYAASVRYNDRGRHLWDAVAINRGSERRDGGNQFFELAAYTPGYDDLITRGNGDVRVPAKYFAFIERYRPRRNGGHWEFYGNFRYAVEGLDGFDGGSFRSYLEASYHVNDSLRFFTGIEGDHREDWLLWRGGNLLGSYEADILFLNAGATWLIDDRHELRVRLENIGLHAHARQAYRVAANGDPVASTDAIDDFALQNLGFQVRYRYELAPLSHLYIAYVRGGSLFDEGFGPYDAASQLVDAFGLRDSEQLLVKISYRFDT
jgi:hypothetical protein